MSIMNVIDAELCDYDDDSMHVTCGHRRATLSKRSGSDESERRQDSTIRSVSAVCTEIRRRLSSLGADAVNAF